MATINFNANEVEPSQEFQPLPEGKYEAVISDSDVKSTRNGSGRYVQLEFEVVSGEHKGRKVWGRYNIENPSADAVRIGRADFSFYYFLNSTFRLRNTTARRASRRASATWRCR